MELHRTPQGPRPLAPRHAINRDAHRSIINSIGDAKAKIIPLRRGQVEIRNVGIPNLIRLEVARDNMTAIAQRLEERRRTTVVRKPFPLDLVACRPLRFDPVGFALAREIRVVVDIADLGVACRVRGWGFGERGHGGSGGVGVEDDLVVRADPAVVPLDDGGGLVPAGFVLAALVGAVGDDNVAARARHDGAIVVPAISPASAARGAVVGVERRPGVPGVLAAHIEDAGKGLRASAFGDADRVGGVAIHGREVLDPAILLRVRP